MQIEVCKSKIHKVTVTEANLQYVGSITIDEDLMDAANLIENEKVQVVNILIINHINMNGSLYNSNCTLV